MRRPFVVLLSSAPLGCVLLAGACSGAHEGAAADAGTDTYGIHAGDGAGSNPDATSDAAAVTASVRLAHAAITLGPVDFCWRASGAASFVGPVLGGGVAPVVDASAPDDAAKADATEEAADEGGDAGSTAPDASLDAAQPGDASVDATTDGGGDAATPVEAGPVPANALVFGQVTPSLTLQTSGTFAIALVRAGQTSCAGPLLTAQVTLDAGKSTTVVIMGVFSPTGIQAPLELVAFTDEPRDPKSAEVRIVHAALGTLDDPGVGPLAVRAGATALAGNVDPGQASDVSSTPPIDGLGYTTLSSIDTPTAIQMSTTGDAAPATWSTAETSLGVADGSVHTGIVVSLEQGELGVAWCTDAFAGDAGAANAGPPCTLLTASK